MKSTRAIAVSSLIWLVSACSMLCVAAQAQASTVAPLPASDYTVQSACAAPAPGHAGCLAQLLVPRTAAARAHRYPLGMTRGAPIVAGRAAEGAYGLRPQDLRSAYFPGEAPDAPASEPQTIALVDVYNDLDAEADLKVYSEEFGLPECTAGNGCFEQVNQSGETGNLPFPASEQSRQETEALCESTTIEPSAREAACNEVEGADEWASEISIDIEVAHAVCQNCRIALVEADSGELSSLEAAEDAAARLGSTEISNSWGGEEPPTDSEAFNHPGTVITVATGDSGYLNWDMSKEEAEREGLAIGGVNYPASSPHVVAVGGTSLTLSGPGEAWGSETVWNGSGGGCSLGFAAQEWQRDVSDWASVGCEGRRAVADVSADAEPGTGVAVYDSVPYVRPGSGLKTARVLGWWTFGGTSVASPIVASMFALAGGSHGVEYPAKTLYSHLGSASLHDVIETGNGKCEDIYSSGCTGSMDPLSLTDCGQGVLICNAAPGYDGPSGVGTPNGIEAFRPARRHTGGGPEAPIAEECGGRAGAEGRLRVCGTLNPHANAKAGYYFAYNKGASCTQGKETALMPEVQGEAIPVSGELFGLEPDTEYAYCLIATDATGETLGAAVTFTTEPVAPKAPETRPVTDIATGSATLMGRLGVEAIQTSWYFEYAPGLSCTGAGAKMTPEAQDATPDEPGDIVSAAVTELHSGTEYAVCLVAKNRIGSTTGPGVWFATEPIPPTVESVSARSMGTEVTFEANISSNAQAATCEVQYGTSESYGSEALCKESLGTGKSGVSASAQVAGLEPGTTYYFRMVAENKAGRSLPSEGKGTVTTQTVKPVVAGESGSGVSTTTAVVAGTLDTEMARTRYDFEYGETEAYGQSTAGGEAPASAGVVPIGPETIAGLKPGTMYYYRLRAVNASSETVGEAKTFTTPTSSPIVATVTPVVIPTTPVTTTTPSTCNVSLASARIMTKGTSEATIELTGTGTGTCQGKLILTVRTKGNGKRRRSKATTIGTATLSIPPGKTTAVELALNARGRALLSADHGRLNATLTVLKSSPAPAQTHTEKVQLVRQEPVKAKKPSLSGSAAQLDVVNQR